MESDYKNIEKEGVSKNIDVKVCFNLPSHIAATIAIFTFACGFVLTSVAVALFPSSIIQFFFIYQIGIALGILTTFLLKVPIEQLEIIKNSRLILILLIVYAVINIFNTIYGCTAKKGQWLLAILAIAQIFINAFYNYNLIKEASQE